MTLPIWYYVLMLMLVEIFKTDLIVLIRSVLKISTSINISTIARPIGLAALLPIMSVSTFKTTAILCIHPTYKTVNLTPYSSCTCSLILTLNIEQKLWYFLEKFFLELF